jgi:hypothetical protein
MDYYPSTNLDARLKIDIMGEWIRQEWLVSQPAEDDWTTAWIQDFCVNQIVLAKFNREFELEDQYRFSGYTPLECPVLNPVEHYDYAGHWVHQTGAFVYQFTQQETGKIVEVLVMASHYSDQGHMVCLACMPRAFIETWASFSAECGRLQGAFEPTQKVIIIGGRAASFVPTTDWEEVILPTKLKSELLENVESFFSKGVDVYKRLNLKPFRKLLLAGVPGTGKTMLCSALAKWAIDREYLVIYISSADPQGSTFGKIQQALSMASVSRYPTLVILEELDAYLHNQEKAMVLNVLDGAESFNNEKGTLLIATTNYPEAIDERILKRPGRLDRIFIIPETRDQHDAEMMLRKYLGDMWSDDHRILVSQLVGYPGAFIREVAVYALTQLAHVDGAVLSLDLLENSFRQLKEQIDARDDFLIKRNVASLVNTPNRKNGH